MMKKKQYASGMREKDVEGGSQHTCWKALMSQSILEYALTNLNEV